MIWLLERGMELERVANMRSESQLLRDINRCAQRRHDLYREAAESPLSARFLENDLRDTHREMEALYADLRRVRATGFNPGKQRAPKRGDLLRSVFETRRSRVWSPFRKAGAA